MTVCKYHKCKGLFKKKRDDHYYCTPKCREYDWKEKNKERFLERQRVYRNKNKKEKSCRHCNNKITLERRNSGVQTCSDKCSEELGKTTNQIWRRRIQFAFKKYKESIGCQQIKIKLEGGHKTCEYNDCGDALDFHHTKPEEKKRRITAFLWYSQSEKFFKELNKCELLCKNCHAEVHSMDNHYIVDDDNIVWEVTNNI